MFGKCLENVRNSVPLVHNITNYVTVNDVANVLYACGGSPIMSDEPEDVADITSICGGLNINIGTLNKRSIEAMYLAGARANELGHAVLLDPVGAGASKLRTDTATGLMEKVKFDVMGEKLEQVMMNARVGAAVAVSFDVESREWQGRWYTDLKAWKIMAMDGQGQQKSPVPNPPAAAPSPAPQGGEGGNKDDLPF
jgi:hydroxyethylthiazole kinase